ncbi:hypothetical protein TWF128_000405 [Orbilia oligospora]|nr:hypothetical protein TWF128_000405 [Orbilia oligospora]
MYFIYYYEADEEVPLNLVHQHRFHKPCQSMTAIFVRDFGLAKISFTIPGTLKLQKAWAEFTGGDFVSGKDIDDLLDAINREFYKGAADHIEDQLYQTCMWEKFNPSSPEFIPWRNKPAWSRYQQYKLPGKISIDCQIP